MKVTVDAFGKTCDESTPDQVEKKAYDVATLYVRVKGLQPGGTNVKQMERWVFSTRTEPFVQHVGGYVLALLRFVQRAEPEGLTVLMCFFTLYGFDR